MKKIILLFLIANSFTLFAQDIIIRKSFTVNPTQVKIDNLETGSYIFNIETDKGSFSEIIIKN